MEIIVASYKDRLLGARKSMCSFFDCDAIP